MAAVRGAPGSRVPPADFCHRDEIRESCSAQLIARRDLADAPRVETAILAHRRIVTDDSGRRAPATTVDDHFLGAARETTRAALDVVTPRAAAGAASRDVGPAMPKRHPRGDAEVAEDNASGACGSRGAPRNALLNIMYIIGFWWSWENPCSEGCIGLADALRVLRLGVTADCAGTPHHAGCRPGTPRSRRRSDACRCAPCERLGHQSRHGLTGAVAATVNSLRRVWLLAGEVHFPGIRWSPSLNFGNLMDNVSYPRNTGVRFRRADQPSNR